MQTWQAGFAPHGLTVAQVLLTHEDLRVRSRYPRRQRNAPPAHRYGTIPIINENDTVSAAEIKFGDNDTLSAMVASLVDAQHLVILSTAPGLIDMKGTGEIVPVVEQITPEIEAMAGGTTSETAIGGMISKIIRGETRDASRLRRVHCERIGTRDSSRVCSAAADRERFSSRMACRWKRRNAGSRISSGRPAPSSSTSVPFPVLREQGRSLLAIGVTGARGEFAAGDIINIAGPDQTVFARGKVTFSSEEIPGLAGKKGDEVGRSHPNRKRLEVVHRNDLVLLLALPTPAPR